MKARVLSILVAITMLVAVKSVAGWNVINVPAGGDLQAALDNAKPGDSIRLAPGATYTGHFVLRAKGGTTALPIIIRSQKDLPAGRVSPASASLMPKIKSPDSAAAIATDPGVPVSGYVLKYLEVVANEKQSDLIMFGSNDDAQTHVSQMPHEFEIDRCYVHGTSTSNSKRGVNLNAKTVRIHDSYFSDFHVVAQDSQAISGFNGSGPYDIENNYIEGAGENILFGGDDPKIVNLVQADITFRHNHVTRPMSWKGGPWQIKNLFELKNAERVLVEGNVFENHWPQAQSGAAILFTPRNQNGTAPLTVVGDVTFRYNVIRNVSSAIEIMGYDYDQPSLQTHDITISNNTVSVNSKTLGGDGRFINLAVGAIGGAKNVHIVNNTVNNDGSSVLYANGSQPFYGFEYNDNLSLHNTYGIMGSGTALGNATLASYFPGGQFLNNVLAGGNAKLYPTGNLFPTVSAFTANFVNFSGGNLSLTSSSTYYGMGADVAKVLSMTQGVK